MDQQINFGRIYHEDERDKDYPASILLQAISVPEEITEQYWWDNGAWLNQGTSSQCTVYSWSHWLGDGPVIQYGLPIPVYDLNTLYKAFQLNDGIPGTGYPGTTVRAGAKVLKKLGFIKQYRWANSLDDVIKAVLLLGPVVAGTEWFMDMAKPDSEGLIKKSGKSMGGHAYVINGVDIEKQLFRIKNSWGRTWGKDGHAFITFDDFESLLKNKGECCIALENVVNDIPSLDSIINEDVANG